MPFQYGFDYIRSITWYSSSYPVAISYIWYLLCVGCQFFIFASTCSASRSNLFSLTKHALVSIRILAIAYGLGRTPLRFSLLPAMFFNLFFCYNNTENRRVGMLRIVLNPFGCRVTRCSGCNWFLYKNSQFHLSCTGNAWLCMRAHLIIDSYSSITLVSLSTIFVLCQVKCRSTFNVQSIPWIYCVLQLNNRHRMGAYELCTRNVCQKVFTVLELESPPYGKRARSGIAFRSDGRGQGV